MCPASGHDSDYVPPTEEESIIANLAKMVLEVTRQEVPDWFVEDDKKISLRIAAAYASSCSLCSMDGSQLMRGIGNDKDDFHFMKCEQNINDVMDLAQYFFDNNGCYDHWLASYAADIMREFLEFEAGEDHKDKDDEDSTSEVPTGKKCRIESPDVQEEIHDGIQES